MPSPFPGMDPYLEAPAIWPDFHNALAGELRAALNTLLPRELAWVRKRVVAAFPNAAEGRS